MEKTIKIFLASSTELKTIRNEFLKEIAKLNTVHSEDNIWLEPKMFELESEAVQLTRSQDAYNRLIGNSRLFFLVLSGRIGKLSEEEFEEALKFFKDKGKPKIFVYIDESVGRENGDESLKKFRDRLRKDDVGYFVASYENTDQLMNKIHGEIENFVQTILRKTRKNTSENKLNKQIGTKPLRPQVFIGRDGVLADIYHAFFEEEKTVLMLVGNGGFGKTTIASKYYHEYQDAYSHYIWSQNSKNLEDTLLSLAGDLGLKLDDQASRNEQINQILREIDKLDKPTLWVIDNVDDYDDLVKNHTYLKQTSNVHILITSRLKEFEEFDKHNINILKPEDAKDLFLHHYKRYDEKTEGDLLHETLKAIGYNTLVIELMAKNLNKTKIIGYKLEDLLKDLQTKGILGIAKERSVAHGYHQLKETKPTDVIKAMYDIAALSKEEADILKFFSVLPEMVVLRDDLEKFIEADIDIIGDLVEKGWLDASEDGDGFKINTILAEIIRDKYSSEDIYHASSQMISIINSALRKNKKNGRVKNCEIAKHYAQYVNIFVNYLKHGSSELMWLYSNMGNFLENRSNIQLALSYFYKYHTLILNHHNIDPCNTHYLQNLIISYSKLGNLEKNIYPKRALKHFEKSVELAKKLTDMEQHNVKYKYNLAVAYSKLGTFHNEQGNREKSLSYFNEYFKILSKLYKSDTSNINYLHSLAIACEKLGDVQNKVNQAEYFFRQAYNLSKQVYNTNPKNIFYKNSYAVILLKLARVLSDKQLALKYIDKSRNMLIELCNLNPDNMLYKNNLVEAYILLGNLYNYLGDLIKTRKAIENALKLSQEISEVEFTKIDYKAYYAWAHLEYAKYLKNTNKRDEAREYAQKSVDMFKQVLAKVPNHPEYSKYAKEAEELLGELKK